MLERPGYRAFVGARRTPFFRCVPLAVSGIRQAAGHKLSLAVLYALPVGWMIVACYNVYIKYAVESGVLFGGDSAQSIPLLLRGTSAFIEVKVEISRFFTLSRFFGVLIAAWYGSGLLAEDRRLKANLLYFARPLTRRDYLLGKFFVVFFFASLGSLVPGLVICLVAAYSSPDWSFLEKDASVLWGTILYGLTTVVFYSLCVLAVSSLAPRRSLALAGSLGVLMVPHMLGLSLQRLTGDRDFGIVSPLSNLGRIGNSLLGRHDWYHWPVEHSYYTLGAFALLFVAVLIVRVNRWEVIG